ncbi:virulence factor TspB C-terminal domain-related protein [Marinobacter adhaerens]|uniref:virulence factor TspB C-terminal domain-related protein n=1 Tax=Marinobacter adhaerens TaxID=1033846 RepID=UPI001E489E2D|nr:virulence factor TspB C-terminal domain-related protein [Marinobacter adhaerens]MCD1646979.1 hypothetical protein [Marinobacter adhaerens]
MCFSTTPITWHYWRSLPAFGLLLASLLLSVPAEALEREKYSEDSFPATWTVDHDQYDKTAACEAKRQSSSATSPLKYAYCEFEHRVEGNSQYLTTWGYLRDEVCGTGTIPGGDFVSQSGPGIYAIGGCDYYCAVNYTLLDGQTSHFDASQCKGQGTPATETDGYVRPPNGSECLVFDDLGRCLDMDQQEGGACPTGTTYGQVNGEDVCVPSGESTDGLDEGTQGPEGEGGDTPDDGSGTGDGDGSGDGTGDGDGSDGGDTCVPSETEDCEGEGDGSDGECVPTEDQPCDEGDGSYSSNGCEAPPECEGDAIQCGIVQETWEDRCLIHEASDQADDFFNQQTNGIGNLNDEGLELVDSMDMDLSEEMTDFTAVSDPAPASCPEPVQLNLSLGAYEVEFTAFCDLAEQVRPLTLFIFSFLGALSIARAVMGVI